ncbi:hypothetical protein THAOC_10815, partial [Thalassiosira oceanica]
MIGIDCNWKIEQIAIIIQTVLYLGTLFTIWVLSYHGPNAGSSVAASLAYRAVNKNLYFTRFTHASFFEY